MAHNIIMQVFERSSSHNMPLRSRPEFMEKFSKIQEAFQRLENSYAEVSRKESDNKENDLDEDNDSGVAYIDQEEDDQVTLLEEEKLARSEGNDTTKETEFEYGMDLEFQAPSISPNQGNTEDNGTIQNLNNLSLSSTPASVATHTRTIGIIHPLPDIRNIVDKTAQFVAHNGPKFEKRILANKKNNAKFKFLNPSNPYHAYYEHRVSEFKAHLQGQEAENARANGTRDEQNGRADTIQNEETSPRNEKREQDCTPPALENAGPSNSPTCSKSAAPDHINILCNIFDKASVKANTAP